MKANHRLKSARILRGWSQAKVAEEVGTDPVTVSRWERGLSSPYPYFREKLCLLFGKNAEELGLVQKQILEEALTALYDPMMPLPLTGAIGLVGRDAMMIELRHAISAGKTTCIALHGLPGVGKTALAIQLAYDAEIRDHFSDGILWAGLGPQPSLLDQLSRWGALLETAPSESSPQRRLEAWAKAIHTAIGTRRMLLVIDDAWTIEAALALKVGGPNCVYIVTTRFPQIALQFAPDNPVILHELSEDDGVRLITQWAPEVIVHEQQGVHELIHLVGGLPLALTLMSKYLRQQTYNQQSRRMQAALKLLHDTASRLQLTEVRGVVEHHPSLPYTTHLSLQSVIMVSDQHLASYAQAALRSLSVFPPKPNTFSEEAASAVCALPVEVFDVLTDAGLLENNSPGRYTLHQTIFDYAVLHYQEQGASERLVAYFMNFIEAHETDYASLELESTNILSAFEVAYRSEKYSEFVCMICSFARFWQVRASYELAEGYLQRAYTLTKNTQDAYKRAYILQYLGYIYQQWGNYKQSEAYLNEGLLLARNIDDAVLTSLLLSRLGYVSGEQGNYEQAEAYCIEGLTLARKVGDAGLQSSLLENLGYIVDMLGDYTQMNAYFQEGLILARQVGNPELISPLLMNIGVAERERGYYKQAEMYLHEGLELVYQMGDKRRISFFLTNLGELEYERGNYTQAEKYLQEGLTIARQIGHREKIVSLLVPLGMVERDRGNLEQAEEYLQEGLLLARAIEHREWKSNVLRNLGAVALLREEYKQAALYLHEALSLAREIQYCALIAGVLLNLGVLATRLMAYEQAEAYLQEGLMFAKKVGHVWLLCSLFFCLGEIYLQEQHIELASAMFNEMLITVPKENRDLMPKALYGLARVAYMRGDMRTARMLGTKSCETLQAIGHHMGRDIEQWLSTLPTP